MKKNRFVTPLVGKLVGELRKQSGITQNQLSASINITRQQLVNLEGGKSGTTIDNIYLIACILKRPISDLFPPLKEVEKVVGEKEVIVKRKVITFNLK